MLTGFDTSFWSPRGAPSGKILETTPKPLVGSTFSEKDGLPGRDMVVPTFKYSLRPVHKSELNESFVTRPHEIFVHFKDLGTLTNNSAVDYSLIIRLDCCSMMQDEDFCFKIIDALGNDCFVQHNHSFSEIVSLQGVFLYQALDCEADSLTCDCFFYRESLVVNRFDLDWLKDTTFVWTKVQLLIWHNCSRFKCTSDNEANTCDLVDSINIELNGIIW